jgi:primosomal protein N' (replication factor Y)
MKQARKDKATSAHFSHRLLDAIRNAVAKGEQVILFQNRRGYSPYLECPTCGYVPSCSACNVKLTYHKNDRQLVCHYCGQTHPTVYVCPHCKITAMEQKGYGTERVEEELMEQLPHLRIGRMDLDTTRNRDAFQRIVADFENHQMDVLIGTQMITKGLDFSRLSLVGVLNADNLLNYPDFRSGERSFQLLSQVAGRAGRRETQGLVLIQTSMPTHSILQQVLKQDYVSFYHSQAEERIDFLYPPFVRIIQLTLKHKDEVLLVEVADLIVTIFDEYGQIDSEILTEDLDKALKAALRSRLEVDEEDNDDDVYDSDEY